MRRFNEVTSTNRARPHLDILVDRGASAEQYRRAMYELGCLLGREILEKIQPSSKTVLLACTVEDADFLARGILEELEKKEKNMFVSCFWNKRFDAFGIDELDVAPIIRKYEEPSDRESDALVIVKSIISGACVVKTNLMDIIERKNPKKILVVAPVLYVRAEENLRREFPEQVHQKFEFVYFAVDDEKADDGNIEPGIGGEVYTRLGFLGEEDKNTYIPELVKQRRRETAAPN